MSKEINLQVGDPAPDFTVLDVNGKSISLHELSAQQPVVLTFVRHFG